MIKLCVIGNSHTGALKRVWDKSVKAMFESKFTMLFFAQRANGLSDLKLEKQTLLPQTESLRKAFEFT